MNLSAEQRRAIDRLSEGLIEAAEQLIESGKQLLEKTEGTSGKFGKSQFRNLSAVACETDSPRVVGNFVLYQMGRDQKRKGWYKRLEGGSTLGDLLIEQISDPKGIVIRTLSEIPDLTSSEVKQQAHIELIRLFIGFATRYMTYKETVLESGKETRQ